MNSSRVIGKGRIIRVLLERIELGDQSELQLELLLAGEAGPAVSICFHGVTGLTFRGATTDLTELVVLLAYDLSGRQWENVAYRVVDAEEEVLSFVCARIVHLTGSDSRAAEET